MIQVLTPQDITESLEIEQEEDKLCIHLSVEYLFKPHSIDITLSPEKKNFGEIIRDLCTEVNSLKNEIKEIKNNNENLKIEINE
jgi:hypothetical protein